MMTLAPRKILFLSASVFIQFTVSPLISSLLVVVTRGRRAAQPSMGLVVFIGEVPFGMGFPGLTGPLDSESLVGLACRGRQSACAAAVPLSSSP